MSKIRDEKLPELISKQLEEVQGLWDSLHIVVESRPRFQPPTDSSPQETNTKHFEFLQTEILRLKLLLVELHPILECVNQREGIMKDYVETQLAASDPNRLMSRGKGCAQLRMKEEKARRRYKVALPKLEKKLYAMLTNYKKQKGVDFEWDGKPYVEQLSYVAKNPEKPEQSQSKYATLGASPKTVHFIHKENDNAVQMHFSIRPKLPLRC
jgi:hypothetical protein